MTKVVTYQDTRGNRVDVCRKCEERMTEEGTWIKNEQGEELCTVSHGIHEGICDCCKISTKNTREYRITGYESCEKTARAVGSGAHIYVPKNWIGKKIFSIKLD